MITKKKLNGKDILLVLLYLPGKGQKINEPIIGKTRLMKTMFLFEKELYKNFNNIDGETLPEFFTYDYGPFSNELLDSIKFFEMSNFIEEKSTGFSLLEPEWKEYLYNINNDVGYGNNLGIFDVNIPGEVKYQLTKNGIKYVEENILDKINEEQKKVLIKFKKKINTLSLDAILEYVYNKYPESCY